MSIDLAEWFAGLWSWLGGLGDALVQASGEPWLLPALFALTVSDALLPILPSESAVVALGAVAAAGGQANPWLIIPVAAVGAFVGDSILFWLGRRIDPRAGRLSRRPTAARMLAYAERGLSRRGAAIIMTARYVPLGRIVVSLLAGATRFPYPRYALLSGIACITWALYNTAIGAFFGRIFAHNVVLAIGVSVVVAVGLGVLIDAVLARRRGVGSAG